MLQFSIGMIEGIEVRSKTEVRNWFLEGGLRGYRVSKNKLIWFSLAHGWMVVIESLSVGI